jgi:hypothetical protein
MTRDCMRGVGGEYDGEWQVLGCVVRGTLLLQGGRRGLINEY